MDLGELGWVWGSMVDLEEYGGPGGAGGGSGGPGRQDQITCIKCSKT